MANLSRTRPYHGPTQIFKEEFLDLPMGTKIRMHHFIGDGIVAFLIGFRELTYVVATGSTELDTEYGIQIWEPYYTDSGLVEYDTNKWNPNNWTSVEALSATPMPVHTVREVTVVERPTEFDIRWQEAGF